MMAPWKSEVDTRTKCNKKGATTSTTTTAATAMELNDEATHRKRLAQILRYIASMHHSLDAAEVRCSFVQQVDSVNGMSLFFQHEASISNNDDERGGGVLFSTDNFRHLLAMESDASLFASPPFSFYAAQSSSSSSSSSSQSLLQSAAAKKRTFAGALKSAAMQVASVADDDGLPDNKACWFRITRMTSAQVSSPPEASHPDVRRYLDDWLAQTPQANRTLDGLLTKRRLEQAPKVPPTVSMHGGQEIKSFLRKYKKHLRKVLYQRQLEPIYNRLFEWVQNQQGNHDELVWGLGHAFQLLDDGATLVNGPVCEVLVEVELARDGALLVRPREHTGVALNREVVAALRAETDHGILQQLHRTVAELEPSQLSPGQPTTYIPLLKRIAVQLSSGGSFQPSSASSSSSPNNKASSDPSNLVVSEAWCLYARPKPSSVWARDATAFADQLMRNNSMGCKNEFVLPRAAWALTHGPGSLELSQNASRQTASIDHGVLKWISSKFLPVKKDESPEMKPLFPLASSDAQNRIADLLLSKNYPAVVCEGPPGTGKTQTIANVICAYLCQGKRVLVTSKNAPALSVLRNRLPAAVQELCVDVSMSESSGVRQLQLTVERLANRLGGQGEDQRQTYLYLQKNIEEHEKELSEIDNTISRQSESIRQLVKHPNGQQLIEVAVELLEEVPWLMATIAKWTLQEVSILRDRVMSLVLEEGDPAMDVNGFSVPPTDALVSLVASKAGAKMSIVSNAAKSAVAAIPLVGSLSGMEQHTMDLRDSLSKLWISGRRMPTTPHEWSIVLRALKHAQAVYAFEQDVWKVFQRKDAWPDSSFLSNNDRVRGLHDNLEKAIRLKKLAWTMNVGNMIDVADQCRSLDAKRSLLVSRIQSLAEELVNATVVAELSRSFSDEAHSALIRFSQIAGKAKFNKSQQPSKMSQRQRRRRQDYLDAFDKCCRFIPCWILTTSQISDFLAPECLFDLVINDETSQSDVTVLPGMLRGRQWLIVGDGKQVSPTESFVSEDQIESLRAALPTCPLETALLPGQSFFDLCAQAFPAGRVVLNEHFRSASEIIAFSNSQFYDDQLVPLRLPKKSERISPSIVDVKVQDGKKEGKTNVKEAEEIVRRVEAIVSAPTCWRSIGIISLLGNEQSRLIRGRLLDAIGPHLMARHDVLVGDPPAFQGAERDIIFLSMVCSRGKTPTQSQLTHFQRANVALSRARDQCVLVRSLEISDIPSVDDMKIPIIEFFQTFGSGTDHVDPLSSAHLDNCHPAQRLLARLLTEQGYVVRSMGVVWKNGICIEHPNFDNRAALMVDCAGESLQDWHSCYRQQKAIERVGWKCLRVDILSLLTNCKGTLDSVMRFLSAAGVDAPAILYDGLDDEDDTMEDENGEAPVEVEDQEDNLLNVVPVIELVDQDDDAADDPPADDAHQAAPDARDIVVISSDDEKTMDVKPRAKVKPEPVASGSFSGESDEVDPWNFGRVVDLAFLRGSGDANEPTKLENINGSVLRDDENQADQFDLGETSVPRTARQRKSRRLVKHMCGVSDRRHRNMDTDDDPDEQSKDWCDINSERRRNEDDAEGQEEPNESPYAPNDDERSELD